MQGPLSLPQRLSLHSLTTLQSYRTFGFCSLSHWQGLEFEKTGLSKRLELLSTVQSIRQRISPGVTNDLPLQGTVTTKGLAFTGNKRNTTMRGCSFATTPSCAYKPEVTGRGLHCAVLSNPGKSCGSVQNSSSGISKPFQHQALQWRSPSGYVRKPVVRVGGMTGGQDVLVKEEEFEFKRVVSESDTITTFYSSDMISSSSDDEVEEDQDRKARKEKEKKTKTAKAYVEDSDSESDDDGEKGTDLKKSLQKPENYKSDTKGLGKYDDMVIIEGEVVGTSEDSDSESDDEKEKKQTKKGDMVGKYENSDSESEDEHEKKSINTMVGKSEDSDGESDDQEGFLLTEEAAKAAKAELKAKEKLDKDSSKAMKKNEKKQKKEAKKLQASKKYEEKVESDDDGDKQMKLDRKEKGGGDSDSDSESDNEEGEHTSNVKMETKLKIKEDQASDSEYEEEDDGVTDFDDDALEKSVEDFVITEDENVALGIQNEIADVIEDELDDVDEDDDFWDDDEGDVVVGDGGTGGGVVLGGTEWGEKALDVAEQVVAECGKDLAIFAFKVSSDRVIRVRLDKLSDRYGSPTMTDIEGFSRRFSAALEESGEAGTVPKDIDVEVSSPGAERVVRVPDDLERFKELPMYVQYLEDEADLAEKDGVFELDSLDMDGGLSVWKIANVKLNREVKGRGRPLNSKQKKWRASIPFVSLKQVRLYLDV